MGYPTSSGSINCPAKMKRHIIAALCLCGVLASTACQVSDPSLHEHDENSVLLDSHWYQIPKSRGRIRELEFSGTKFRVTYFPFESYIDFWGSFNWDPETHGINMTIDHANHAPEPFDGHGTLQFITPNRIRISGVTLDDQAPRLKTFTFERFDADKAEPAGPSRPDTKPAEKVPAKGQPSTPTPRDGPPVASGRPEAFGLAPHI
jgi:hypothetical protein